MEGISEMMREAKRWVSNRIDRDQLKPGDHIYAYRIAAMYSHHGIFIGGDKTKYVIHFTQPTKQNVKLNQEIPCPECGCWKGMQAGVVKSCLDCFMRKDKFFGGHSIHLYDYGVSDAHRNIKRAGSCTTHPSTKTPEQVVELAEELRKVNNFGEFHLTKNNCEHFATYCKTGKRISAQAKIGIKMDNKLSKNFSQPSSRSVRSINEGSSKSEIETL